VRAAVKIRNATAADVQRCREIDVLTEAQFDAAGHPEFLNGSTIPDDAAARAIDEQRMMVAVVDGQVVGWVYLTRMDHELCIGQIAVDPVHQQRGIGTELLEHVIRGARRNGEPTIVLNTQDDIGWNRPWYERFGFVTIPREDWTMSMYSIVEEHTLEGLDWSTRVHMRLVLNDDGTAQQA
jgi:predicted N-acetyltransferase YhbS